MSFEARYHQFRRPVRGFRQFVRVLGRTFDHKEPRSTKISHSPSGFTWIVQHSAGKSSFNVYIKFQCQQCGKRLKLPQDMLHKKAKCPRCGFVNRPHLKDQQPGPATSASMPAVSEEIANATSFHVDSVAGSTFGPVTWEQLQTWVDEGRVTPACIIRTDQGQAYPAAQLFPQLEATESIAASSEGHSEALGDPGMIDADWAELDSPIVAQPAPDGPYPVATPAPVGGSTIPAGGASGAAASPTQASNSYWNQASSSPYQSPVAKPAMRPAGKGGSFQYSGGRLSVHMPDVGSIVSVAWSRWAANLGVLVGGILLLIFILFGLGMFQGFVLGMLAEATSPQVALGVNLVFALLNFVLQTYLGIGYTRLVLLAAKGEEPEIGEMFHVGADFGPVLGAVFLFTIALTIGLYMWLVPGILLGLFFWPYYYLLVDQRSTFGRCFQDAAKIASRNVGNTILLFLISFGITLAGLLALGIGLLFAAPLVSMIWVVGYLMMTGQLRAGP